MINYNKEIMSRIFTRTFTRTESSYNLIYDQVKEAVYEGDREKVKRLFTSNIDINNYKLKTILHIAINNGDRPMVKLLLDLGANPNNIDETYCKWTTHQLAVYLNHHEIASLLSNYSLQEQYNNLVWENNRIDQENSQLTIEIEALKLERDRINNKYMSLMIKYKMLERSRDMDLSTINRLREEVTKLEKVLKSKDELLTAMRKRLRK